MPCFGLILLVVLITAIVDISGADEHQIRGLPRVVWVLLIVLVPLAGAIAWFIAGRPIATAQVPREPGMRPVPSYGEPGRFVLCDSIADEEFRRRCRERAEWQRHVARRQRGNTTPD